MTVSPLAIHSQNKLKEKKQNFQGKKVEDKRLRFQKGKQKELFAFLFEKHSFTHKELAEKLGFKRKTVSDYFKEKNNITFSSFQKLISIDPRVKKFEKFVEERMPINWGASKGGFARAQLITDKDAYYGRIRKIKALKELKEAKRLKPQIRLHHLIRQLKKEGVNLKAVLAVCLLTDGSLCINGNNYRISYATSDPLLEKIIFSLMNEVSQKLPRIGFTTKANIINVSDEKLGKELLKLSPNFKTSPSWYQTKKEYFKEPQPTLRFLLNENEQTKKWAIMFGFTADGSISLSKIGKPELCIACCHPTLPLEWKKLLEEFGISCSVIKNKNSWCGISMTRAYSYASIKKFYKLGGFIDGVKISRKSKRYVGITKNELLEHVVKLEEEKSVI